MAIEAEQRFHVLAVDDSLIDRKLIERLLRISSYQVTTVDSVSKALEFLGLHDEKHIPPPLSCYQQDIEVNLIITDYCMPGMTGYDLLRKIKESSYLRDIPVVIMSSENAPSRISRCLEEGAEEFFLKPVQLSDMERLRPHILKGKSRDLGSQQAHQLPPSQPPQEEEHELQINAISDIASSITFIKRKAHDEGLSPDRTRARYRNSDNLTVI